MLSAYRRTGADLPFGNPVRPHGVAMEGWFWRFTQPASGAVVIALAAVNRAEHGRAWGTVGIAGHPGGFSASAAIDDARADRRGGLAIGHALRAWPDAVALDLGPDARLEVAVTPRRRWPRRAFGGIGPAHAVPGLSQYWHPWLLEGRATGRAIVGGHTIGLDGAVVYAEKNWSNGGFPDRWWWGQSHGFADDPAACVAFAGGRAGLGPVRMDATSLVVAAGGRVLRLVHAGPLGARRLQVDVGDHGWRLRGRSRDGVEVVVDGHANGTRPHLLPIPLPSEGRNHPDSAAQHLAGELRLTLRRNARTLFDGTSALAGLERGTAPLGV